MPSDDKHYHRKKDEEKMTKAKEVTIVEQIRELVDQSAKLSVSYVNQLRVNDMREVMKELADMASAIKRVESRLDKASSIFKSIDERVKKLEETDVGNNQD